MSRLPLTNANMVSMVDVKVFHKKMPPPKERRSRQWIALSLAYSQRHQASRDHQHGPWLRYFSGWAVVVV